MKASPAGITIYHYHLRAAFIDCRIETEQPFLSTAAELSLNFFRLLFV